MLRIYSLAISIVADAGKAAVAIAKFDRDLARQLRRAAASVPLNIAEGAGVSGGNRRVRYQTALGSAYEVRACLDVAAALGYIDAVSDRTKDGLGRVLATLTKLAT